MADFVSDMGVSRRRVLENDGEALDALANWGGLSAAQMQEISSWTGERIGDVRMRFRDEVFVSRALRSPTIRGCPVCLREDAKSHGGPAVEAMAMRGDWLLREVVVCLRHRHPLVPLWQALNPTDRYDIAPRLQEIEAEILAGSFDQPPCEASFFDIWLDRRLEDGADETWLGQYELYPAATFCRLLGAELLRLDPAKPLDAFCGIRAAQAAGFTVAVEGETGIRSALDRLANAAMGYNDTAQKAFGQLYIKLRRAYSDEPAFKPFLELLRNCILSVWSIPAGDDVVGEILTERRLHSLHSAAAELGTTKALLEPFLVEAGAIPAVDPRPASRRVFDVNEHAELLAEIPHLASLRALREAIGASRNEIEALVDEGILTPRCASDSVRLRWSLEEGRGLLESLVSAAQPIDADPASWEGLLKAKNRAGVSLTSLIDAIRGGNLSVGSTTDAGFSGLRVARAEVDLLSTTSSRMPIGLIPAAAFGVSVGIRGEGRFLALISGEHTPGKVVRHPNTGAVNVYVDSQDITNFHNRFVTITTLVKETGLHRNTLRKRLDDVAVPVFAPGGGDFGFLYLREVVRTALRLKLPCPADLPV